MSRLTGSEVANLMQAYNAVYSNDLREEMIFEEFLTEEFILEAYQYVADFLVHEGHVPGYNTAEVFIAEMDEHWIDEILCDYGLYLNEGPFGNFANTVIGGAKRAAGAVAGGVRKVAGAADRGVAGAVRAGQAIKGTAQRAAGAVARGATAAGQAAVGGAVRAGQAVSGAAQRAGQTVSGAAQRAAGAVTRAATPVAQAVKGTAQRAVAAGQSALGGAARAGQAAVGGAVRAGQALAGGAARAGQAVSGAAKGAVRKIGQEIEISRKVGAGEPLSGAKPAVGGAVAKKAAPVVGTKPAPKPAVGGAVAGARPAAPAAKPAAPATKPAAAKPAAAAPAAAPKLSKMQQDAKDLRDMRTASQQRQASMLKQDFDMFDAVLEYLVAEGYADNNQEALSIMANMTEEETNSVIEGLTLPMTVTAADKKANTPPWQNRDKKLKDGSPMYQLAPHLKGV